MSGCLTLPNAEFDHSQPRLSLLRAAWGIVELREDPSGGIRGVCLFPDGSECDERACLRGERGPTEFGGIGLLAVVVLVLGR